eukprot:15904796-Heterocapsa_arctica.AAC.1
MRINNAKLYTTGLLKRDLHAYCDEGAGGRKNNMRFISLVKGQVGAARLDADMARQMGGLMTD